MTGVRVGDGGVDGESSTWKASTLGSVYLCLCQLCQVLTSSMRSLDHPLQPATSSFLLINHACPPHQIASRPDIATAVRATLCQWLWYLGFPLVPAGICVIGLTHYDVLHSTYLLLTLGMFCVAAVNFQPSVYQAFLGCPHHRVVRSFASVHVALLYVALLATMPGLDGVLPGEWRPWLQVLGLWEVSVVNTLLPLTALILVVR